MTTTYTANYKIPKPDFDTDPWHTVLNGSIDRIDTALYQLLIGSIASEWAVSTAYAVGDIAIDAVDASMWLCLVAHTSGAGAFSADRTANPTYWSEVAIGFRAQGAWANDTDYRTNDVVYDVALGIIGLCTTAHTSSSAPDTINDDAANWDFLFDMGASLSAAALSYDNTDRDLSASNVKDALDELVDRANLAVITAQNALRVRRSEGEINRAVQAAVGNVGDSIVLHAKVFG